MPNDVVTRAIDAVCRGDHLTADHAAAVLDEIMEGRAEQVQTGAFLVALRAKGETVPATSRPPQRWSRRPPAARSPSTATARKRAAAARPTCSRRSA
jgi:hypothetical protein